MRLIETTEKQQHAGQAGYAVTTTSGGALLLEAVVPQLAVVLLSLPSQIGQMEVCVSHGARRHAWRPTPDWGISRQSCQSTRASTNLMSKPASSKQLDDLGDMASDGCRYPRRPHLRPRKGTNLGAGNPSPASCSASSRCQPCAPLARLKKYFQSFRANPFNQHTSAGSSMSARSTWRSLGVDFTPSEARSGEVEGGEVDLGLLRSPVPG